jgi:lipopolysaccharide/colanic/teichoic acid biosynthesis glycosyltransferase
MLPRPEPLPIVWQKRAFDLVAGLFLLALSAPLFLFFVLLIFIEHALRGHPLDPVFYAEDRISRGSLFKLYKFNIFNHRVVETYRQQKKFIHTKELEKNGDLIFVGNVLKQVYLDELPQLFNVLRNEMSLVGPRPLNRDVFARMSVHGVPPVARIQGGMTGNYQSHKNTRGVTAAELEARYLGQYIQRSGWRLVLLDIKILLRTIKVLLRARGV